MVIYIFIKYRIYFVIVFFIYSNNNGTGITRYKHYTDRKSKSYNIATSLTCLQGFFCFLIFGGKILYRYSYLRRYFLIKRYKSNEKKALNDGEETNLENFQIIETLNQNDDSSYDSKNTQINIISTILFQMVIIIYIIYYIFILFLFLFNIFFFNNIFFKFIKLIIIIIIYY